MIQKKFDEPAKILIIRLKPIGDTVLTSAVFRNIKKLYPRSCVEVLVYPFVYDVIKNNPYIDKVIILKRDRLSKAIFYVGSVFKYYDIIIDFINNPTSIAISFLTRTKLRIGNKTKRNIFYSHRIQPGIREYSAIRCLRLLEPLGLKKFVDYMPELFLDPNDIKNIGKKMKTLEIRGKLIGLFVTAKYITRQYSLANYIQLGKLIAKNIPYKVLFIIGKGDKRSIPSIQELTKENKNIFFISEVMHGLSVGELCALISRLKFLVTHDTGPKHIATALNIPTLTIFTSTDDKVWNPPDLKRFPIIKEKLKCSPCHKKKCPKKKIECSLKPGPEKIFSLIKRYLK